MDETPTRWRYPDGRPVPLWHALDTLSCHWRFGYADRMAGRAREKTAARNGNPDFKAAQLAGWDDAEVDARNSLEARGQDYARRFVGELTAGVVSPSWMAPTSENR